MLDSTETVEEIMLNASVVAMDYMAGHSPTIERWEVRPYPYKTDYVEYGISVEFVYKGQQHMFNIDIDPANYNPYEVQGVCELNMLSIEGKL